MLHLLVLSIFILQPIETHYIASKNSKLQLNIKLRKLLALAIFLVGILVTAVYFLKSIDKYTLIYNCNFIAK